MELKEIPGFDGHYGITVDGQVWSYISKRFLEITTRSNGYCVVSLSKDQVWNGYLVHRLVMTTYGLLDLNDKQMVVHHLNGNPLDNRLENLQIMSDSEHCCSHKKGYGINTETHKLCTKCEILKLRSKFNVARNCPDGLQNWCRVCGKKYSKIYYQKNKVTILKRKKEKYDTF